MTHIELARKGIVTEEMKSSARREGVEPEYIRGAVEDGTVVVVRNKLRRDIEPLAVGRGLRTKVNANIGTSEDRSLLEVELEKLRAAVSAGADAIMDLSTGGDVSGVRRAILKECPVALGTVPLYQAAIDSRKKGKSFV